MNEQCAACGMPVADGEYHPHAACVMYGTSRDAEMVRANLAAVVAEGARQARERLAAEERENVFYCEKCDRWQDHRVGCEADVRDDERAVAVKLAEEMKAAEEALRAALVPSSKAGYHLVRRDAFDEFVRRLREDK